MKRLLMILGVVMLGGCGAPSYDPLVLCATTPELETATLGAIDRWVAAGDMDLAYDCSASNVEVRFGEMSSDNEDDMLAGTSDWNAKSAEIVINPAAPEKWVESTIAHELGHIIAADRAHAETGLMMQMRQDVEDPISEASLALVCGGPHACHGWQPEN